VIENLRSSGALSLRHILTGLRRPLIFIKKCRILEDAERERTILEEVQRLPNVSPRGPSCPRLLGLIPQLSAVATFLSEGIPLPRYCLERIIFPKSGSQDLIPTFSLLGRWLRVFHDSMATSHLENIGYQDTPTALQTRFMAAMGKRMNDLIINEFKNGIRESLSDAQAKIVVSHGDFSPKHVLVSDHITILDFGNARIESQYYDISHFVAYLYNSLLSLLFHRIIDRCCKAFLTGYFGEPLSEAHLRCLAAFVAVRTAELLQISLEKPVPFSKRLVMPILIRQSSRFLESFRRDGLAEWVNRTAST
jgi:hypothetical protein